MEYQIIGLDKAPIAVAKWVEKYKYIETHAIIQTKDNTFVVFTRGKKNTGGYDIEVVSVKEQVDQVFVIVKYINPDPDQIVIQLVSYPLLIIRLPRTEKEIIPVIKKV